ncbi:MAG: accessory gene regulator B family protein [Lachnospiraceae bacterium]|nr:accessory gene regulator B family protein [Lachnospiraceae bacterium]
MEQLCTTLIKKILTYTNIRENEEQIEVYVYGLLTYIYILLPLIILYSISIFYHVFIEILIWSILFTTLRKYTGGYHAPHPLLCFLYSITLGISCIFLIHLNISVSYFTYLSICIISLCIFVILSPVTRKDFTKTARTKCKIKISIYLTLFTLLFTYFSSYQIVLLHAALSTLLLCLVEKWHT